MPRALSREDRGAKVRYCDSEGPPLAPWPRVRSYISQERAHLRWVSENHWSRLIKLSRCAWNSVVRTASRLWWLCRKAGVCELVLGATAAQHSATLAAACSPGTTPQTKGPGRARHTRSKHAPEERVAIEGASRTTQSMGKAGSERHWAELGSVAKALRWARRICPVDAAAPT